MKKTICTILLISSLSNYAQEIIDPIHIEGGLSGKTQNNPNSTGVGLNLNATFPLTKFDAQINSITAGSINGKNYLDLDLKLTAMPGLLLGLASLETGTEAGLMGVIFFATNVQGRYQQNYLGNNLSLTIGPMYFGINSYGDFSAKNRSHYGIGATMSKLEVSDFLKQKFQNVGSLKINSYQANKPLVFNNHLNAEDIKSAISLEAQNNPSNFTITEQDVSVEELLKEGRINLSGVTAEANIPLTNKNEWDMNIGFSYQSASKIKGSNTSNYSTSYHGEELAYDQGGIQAYRDVTVVNDAKGSTQADMYYQTGNINLGTSFKIKRIRLWIDGAFNFNEISLKTATQTSSVKFNQASFTAGVKIPLYSK